MIATRATTDTRRITEHDADFQRLHTATKRQLSASVLQLAHDLRRTVDTGEESHSVSAFIHRHTQLLHQAYVRAYIDGQKDFFGAVSRTPGKWAKPPDGDRVRRALTFYAAPSVAKMAHEALLAARQTQGAASATQLDEGDDDSYDWLQAWVDATEPRVELQANATWTGTQQGYLDGPLTDPANPFYYLYWDLEPMARHCSQCPDYSAGSPYTPPGSGVNELDATPGDGHTDCGAACKCSLRYGSGGLGDQSQLQWNQAWKYYQANPEQFGTGEVPPAIAALRQGMPAPVVLPSRDDLSVDQEIALDDYRDASIQWDMARGDALAPMPGLFSEGGVEDWTPPAWDTLTQAQQDALVGAVIAMIDWGAATDDAFQALLDTIDWEGE